jgi:hypothetical protein
VLRNKIEDLRLALVRRFSAHHGQMVGLHLARIDHLDQMLTQVKDKIGRIGHDLSCSRTRSVASARSSLTSNAVR